MRKLILLLIAAVIGSPLFFSCSKDIGTNQEFDVPEVNKPDDGGEDNGDKESYSYTLRELAKATGIKMGVAVTYSEYQDDIIREIAHKEFDNVTFGNEMKNASIVTASGGMNYQAADAMVSELKNAGIKIYGHTLGWHSQQQTTYYNQLVRDAVEVHEGLKSFYNFEDGTKPNSWGTGSTELVDNPRNIFAGESAMAIISTAEGADNPYQFQVNIPIEDVAVGDAYRLTFWMKAKEDGGKMRFSTPNPDYGNAFDISKEWTQYEYIVKVTNAGAVDDFFVNFDMGYVKNTYYVDNIRVVKHEVEEGGGDQEPQSILGDYGTFENLTEDESFFDGWDQMNGADHLLVGTEYVHGGQYALKIDNTAGVSDNWKIQAATPKVNGVADTEYTVEFWLYTPDAGEEIQYDVRCIDADGGNIATQYSDFLKAENEKWVKITRTFTSEPATKQIQLVIYGGNAVGTYYIDDMTITPAAGGETPSEEVTHGENKYDIVDYALRTWVFNMMDHFGKDMFAWDAVNEIFNDGNGEFRSNNGELVDGSFCWGDFLGGGDKFAQRVFKYARAAQDDVVLFVNDFGLENSESKLTGFCDFINANADQIDGVGTQMHISIDTPQENIDNMFKQLASTGKLVKVTELDVATNPQKTSDRFTDEMSKAQTEMYKHVVKSYFENVPAEQRDGITIWGAKDDVSWLTGHMGAEQWPLLFDDEGERKEAYKGFYKTLQSYTDLKEPETPESAE